MTSSGRAFVFAILVVLGVGCTLDDSSDPCGGGCYSGSPHPYTWGGGGPSSTFQASVTEEYDGELVTLVCSNQEGCTWVGPTIEITAALPQGWVGGADAGDADDAGYAGDAGDAGDDDAGGDADAGVDADASADADADAGADAGVAASDAGPVGWPRGWGNSGRVAVIDLGRTPLEESSPLIDARLVTCGDRYEKLATTREGVYTCLSAGARPPRIVPLKGNYTFSSSGSGDSTSVSKQIEATTRTGARVSVTLDARNVPYESHESVDCY